VLAAAPKGGLVGSVGVTQETDSRWVNGMAWRPETCFHARTMQVCGDTHQANQGGTDGGPVYYRPFGLHVETTCNNRFNVTADDEARARRQLIAASSYLLAHELWLGTETQADTYDTPTGDVGITNAYLASASANVLVGTPNPVEAIGFLEEAANQAALGQDVHLHVPRALMPQFGQILVQRGQQWFTPGGALVISDPGYTGSGPAGQAESPTKVWMYATAPVQVRLSDIDTFTIHTVADNTRTMVAERAGAVTFDPCVHFAIDTTLPGSIT
jgi:hypothetical protein